MKKTLSLSIGISAYNEEANIKSLLESLLQQQTEGFSLKEIIVISDGSTDQTVQKVKEIQNKRITVISFSQKRGKSYRLNQLFKLFQGDVLFLLDADIFIKDTDVFSKIIKQSNFKKDGIVSVNAEPLPAHTFFEKVLASSVFVLKEIAGKWNNGKNYLAFKGCFLGFDKTLAQSIRIPNNVVNDDAYLYFFARKKGFQSRYIQDATLFYKSPTTFTDHLKQSSRYQNSQKELEKYFTNLQKEYTIPRTLCVKSILHCFVQNPIYLSCYIIVRYMAKFKREKKLQSAWRVAASTKNV